MPNTLAHFGIQGILTRSSHLAADPKVIFLGCLLPDIPWILQRLIRDFFPGLDPYSVRLYAIAQASLFITLFLCGALALLTKSPVKIFAVLALNSVLHLLIDALQTKWANGVNLFAPFSWKLLNFELFWPESLPTYVLTVFGLGYVFWFWKQASQEPPPLAAFSYRKVLVSVGLLGLYFTLPIFFLNGPLSQDSHFVKTLTAKKERVGRYVEFDRNFYLKTPNGDFLQTFAGDEFRLPKPYLDHSGPVSIRAQFVEFDTIQIFELHEHSSWFRDGSTYVGLFLLLVMWTASFWRNWRLSFIFYNRGKTPKK